MRIRRRQLGEWIAAYVLLSPYLFVFLVFNVFAIAYALYLSFTYFDLFSPPRWVGLGNYLYLLRDNLFLQKAVPNTLKYVAVVVPVQTVISLLLAFALDQEIKFRRFFRTLFYVPSVTSSVVISLIFLWLFKKTGVINQLLGLSIDWLTSPTFALPTIMIVNIWATTGTMMVIFLAGLQDIPVTYYEAAMIDGANRWQMLRHITIPLLRPVIFFVVTMGVIGCFQVFDQIYVMTAGGPLDSTTTIAYLIYKWAFQSTTPFMGRASAVAFVLAGMILIVTVIQRRLIERPGEV
ncbi:Lactose transport system permease protein LacF [Candidatus Thermoflexus japonica]|uniref:Lactose transport system permease protein LacF n=1 Tax=Candidatus Thermoflexus japonica TaxID=2035417 RepID=A0A2H5Y634_9CHLR|nr:Lactose transport system permease protein LacF [Candidatus Thermoflexus japonica]